MRFAQLHTFEAITTRVKRRERSAPDIFMVILEAMIDYGADRLEELRTESFRISQRIFHKGMRDEQTYNVSQVNSMLRDTLVEELPLQRIASRVLGLASEMDITRGACKAV